MQICSLLFALVPVGALVGAAGAAPIRPREARAAVLASYQEVFENQTVFDLVRAEHAATIAGPTPADFASAAAIGDNTEPSASSFAELQATSGFPDPPFVQAEGIGISVSHWVITGDPGVGSVDVDLTLMADALFASAYPAAATDSVRSVLSVFLSLDFNGSEVQLMSAGAVLRTLANGTHTLQLSDEFSNGDFTPSDPGSFDVAYDLGVKRHFENRFTLPVGHRFAVVLQAQSLVVADQPAGHALADFTQGAHYVLGTDTPGAGFLLIPEPSSAVLLLALLGAAAVWRRGA